MGGMMPPIEIEKAADALHELRIDFECSQVWELLLRPRDFLNFLEHFLLDDIENSSYKGR
jgi:hypothetical protein